MKITGALVKHLVELGLDKKHLDAPVDAEVAAFATQCMLADKLSVEKLGELTVAVEKSLAESAIDAAIEARLKSFAPDLIKQFSDMLAAQKPAAQAAGQTVETKAADLGKAGELFAGAGTDGAKADEGVDARVKSAVERYSHNRTALLYSKSISEANRYNYGSSQVRFGQDQTPIDEPSQRDKAVAGAWFKHLLNRSCRAAGRTVPKHYIMTDHDKSLVQWAVHNSEFIGPVGATSIDSDFAVAHLNREKAVGGLVQKALLDDNTSGGLEAVPIEFDNQVIMTALLNGELFPLVNWQTVNRRRQEGYSMGEFTFATTAEGTAITPFSTTSFIAAFDTTIYPIVGAVEVGLDFLGDAPTDIASQIQQRYGDGFLKKMDGLIATGSGTGEMTGLFTTAGLTDVAASGASLPYATADLEGLLFGVSKPYREEAGRGPGSKAIYLSNETVYRRSKAIPWSTETNLRVQGMTHEDFMTLNHPHKINETITSAKMGFFCMNRFKGYRRAGFEVRVESGGATLAYKNQESIIVRARYGGQLSLSAAGAIIDDLPTS